MVADWTKYRHGYWRRIGDTVECVATARTIPAGLIPSSIKGLPIILEYNGLYHIRACIKGWEANTVIASVGRTAIAGTKAVGPSPT